MKKMSPDRKREQRRFYRKEYMTGLLFLGPWLIGFTVFMAYPLLWSLYLSFNQVRLTPTGFKYNWIGFRNFTDALFKDAVFPIELIAYFQEMILMIPIIVVFALSVAIMLNQTFPGRMLYRAVFFLPVIFSTGQVLMELFTQGAGELPFMSNYNIEGLVSSYIGRQFAEPVVNILGKAVIILWYSGVQILIFIAGFQTVSKSVYEAVRIDGASPWESFWKITLPAMVPFIGLNLLYTIVDLFTYPMNPVMKHIRNNMFKPDTGYGYATSLAWLYFILILVLIFIVLWITGRKAARGRRG